ncbi:hypothetical protein J437_LFUL011252 [Ladona fulva]|uniref:5-formyltetrahydrofolate cyclo-ligase n=1 Tax=Ladona fulva TaxID=123851 RepID=A0A8K0KBM9_LADFU|nr:hypothetical protein J437_LFUL011252 [Ladona fulva]
MLVMDSSEEVANLFRLKSELRKELNERINSLTPEEIREESSIVTQKVLQHPKYVKAESVSIYLSFDKEIQTDNIVYDIFEKGKKCYIPRYFQGKPMEMVRLHSYEDYQNLPRNRWNIKQPPKDEARENALETGKLDLILMPGLGFTKDGKRIGRGKGYYDQFLMKCAESLKSYPYTIGLAFKKQMVPDLPTTDEDVNVDEVISP